MYKIVRGIYYISNTWYKINNRISIKYTIFYYLLPFLCHLIMFKNGNGLGFEYFKPKFEAKGSWRPTLVSTCIAAKAQILLVRAYAIATAKQYHQRITCSKGILYCAYPFKFLLFYDAEQASYTFIWTWSKCLIAVDFKLWKKPIFY